MKPAYKKTIFLIFLMLNIKSFSYGQNEKFKALFVYNFIKNIEWPVKAQNGDFVIGVLGQPPIVQELEKIVSKKKIANRNIQIKVFESTESITNCHILFIPRKKSKKIDEISLKINDYPTLIISEKEGLKGSDINFVESDFDLEFEIFPVQIQKKGMRVSGTLINLSNNNK